MAKGRFTGKQLGQYINANQTDFIGVRRAVSGTDRAHHVANLAQSWLGKIDVLESELTSEDVETIDNETAIEFQDIECFAPDGSSLESVPFPAVNVQLAI